MKRNLVALAAGLALLAATLLPVVFHAHPGAAQPSPPPATPRAAAPGQGPHSRQVNEAYRLLKDAKARLEVGLDAPREHRVKAIEHINRALNECELALDAHE